MDVQPEQVEETGTTIPVPRWIAPSLKFAEGRDPLGFQTTTQDRLMPELLPGLLELTRRARYFSFHAFLLDEYQKRRLPADSRLLSNFIKRCEWDLGLSVQRCPRHCGSSPVGARRLGGVASGPGPFPRGESVESMLGGYGLYYRSPLSTFGIVAKAGTLLGDQPIPIDLLFPTDRATQLAKEFRNAIHDTAYYKEWMWTDKPLPTKVVDEYAAVACLCLLNERPDERKAVYNILFSTDPPESHVVEDDTMGSASADAFAAQVMQRRFSIAHYLTIMKAHPYVVSLESSFREGLWSPPSALSSNQEIVAGQWAALIAKDVWQEAVCSVWSEFCRAGRKIFRKLGRGLTWEETRQIAESMVTGPPELQNDLPTSTLVEALAAHVLTISDVGGTTFNVHTASLEELRSLTERLDTATSGLITLLELARRITERSGEGWQQALRIGSTWQPSVASVMAGLRTHLDRAPTVGDSLFWIVSTFVLNTHQRISYSKLPEFTFRFRWEDGLLRFYDHDIDRFPLASIRNEPLASITKDLGFWEATTASDATGQLTDLGETFVAEAFG